MSEDIGTELSREQFIAQLTKDGWRKDEAEKEWEDIQADEEGET